LNFNILNKYFVVNTFVQAALEEKEKRKKDLSKKKDKSTKKVRLV
jgi:hypothetical protein